MSALSLGFQRVKVSALSTLIEQNTFYGETLGLPRAYEGTEQVGYLLGKTILMLKGLYAPPTQEPNPRVPIATENAPQTENALRERGVRNSDPVQAHDDFYVGSFLE